MSRCCRRFVSHDFGEKPEIWQANTAIDPASAIRVKAIRLNSPPLPIRVWLGFSSSVEFGGAFIAH